MPLTLAEFLALEPTLAALRHEIDSADRHVVRTLKGNEAALVQMLERRWTAGLAGWMTEDEARQVAAELTADAARLGAVAQASVEELFDGSRTVVRLVFAGGRHGQHHLDLRATNPVRARAHWEGYLDACVWTTPRPQPEALEPAADAEQPLVVRQQLRMDFALADLLRPRRRRSTEGRPRLLSIPVPKTRR